MRLSARNMDSGPHARTSHPSGTSSVTRRGSTQTSAAGSSAAASACRSLRKPSTTRACRRCCARYGRGAMPMPPPTRSGRSTSRRKPFPRGPSTCSRSPRETPASACVPGRTGWMRSPSSVRVARQRLIGLGRSLPGGASMKNWPGIPDSTRPRRRRRSRYGPTSSTRTTSTSSLRNALLERDRVLASRSRDRLDRCEGACEGGDARNARYERRLADEVAIRARASARRRVDDEFTAPAPDEVDDRGAAVLLAHLAHACHGEARGGQRVRCARGRAELEAELDEPPAELDRGVLVRVADGEEGRTAFGQRTTGRALCLRERRREVGRAG